MSYSEAYFRYPIRVISLNFENGADCPGFESSSEVLVAHVTIVTAGVYLACFLLLLHLSVAMKL